MVKCCVFLRFKTIGIIKWNHSVQDHLQSRDGNLAQYCEFRVHLLEQ